MYEYNAEVLRVVDGDTVDLKVNLGFNMVMTERFRLSDIDAPESRTKDLEEKERGILATEYLRSVLDDAGNKILIETHLDTKGKYGRYLCVIYAIVPPNAIMQNINKLMVNKGHAIFKQY